MGMPFALRAYVLLAVGLAIGGPIGILLIGAGFAVVLGGTRGPRPGADVGFAAGEADEASWSWMLLAALPAMSIVASPPGPTTSSAYGVLTRVFGAVGVVLVGVHAAGAERTRARVVAIVIGLAIALQVATPWAVPRPYIDVWQLFQDATGALLRGADPYGTPVTDIYRGGFDYGYRLRAFTYPPLNLLWAAPARLLTGDYRYASVVAFPATLALLARVARRLALPSRLRDALVLAFALHPRAAFVTAMGWGEPVLVLVFAAMVDAHVRARGTARSVLVCVLVGLKQYLAVVGLLYLALRPKRRGLLLGIALVVATAVPFVTWNPSGAIEDGWLFVARETRFRDDGLSLPAVVYPFAHFGWPKLAAPVAQAGLAALGWWRWRGLGFGGVALSAVVALWGAFLVGWQAFENYYYFVGAALLFAVALVATPGAGREVPA